MEKDPVTLSYDSVLYTVNKYDLIDFLGGAERKDPEQAAICEYWVLILVGPKDKFLHILGIYSKKKTAEKAAAVKRKNYTHYCDMCMHIVVKPAEFYL